MNIILLLLLIWLYYWLMNYQSAKEVWEDAKKHPWKTSFILVFLIAFVVIISVAITASQDYIHNWTTHSENTKVTTTIATTTPDPCANSSIEIGSGNNVHFTGGLIIAVGRPTICTGKDVNLTASGTPIISVPKQK